MLNYLVVKLFSEITHFTSCYKLQEAGQISCLINCFVRTERERDKVLKLTKTMDITTAIGIVKEIEINASVLPITLGNETSLPPYNDKTFINIYTHSGVYRDLSPLLAM